ncbi:hypothetical protein RchiOBHm_Chr1g0355061 [Rosa chinensis]|uniref:Uncharacterized protein n=1 Tax=Rosa chinensis TaxID=74649 RepID=A0A2P6SHA8_ROSCH|nr:uncharacterized protein LOC112181554 [Rosa chinensis]PRQ58057.1 hypothetical protein RchiOBHm_Chr1g0355061 [Rosa chinensis]
MNPQVDKLVRRTTIVATITASYFLLTADYGSEPNVLDPIKKAIQSAESSVKDFIFGSKTQPPESQVKELGPNSAKERP